MSESDEWLNGLNDWLKWHLHPGTGPKRILALDGGGVRGLISLGILQRMEDALKVRCQQPEAFRLAHYFDLIAGTSTGSIIATGLARGMTVKELKELYDRICPIAFKPRSWSGGLLKPIFDHYAVEQELKRILRDDKSDPPKLLQLQSQELLTGLMICSKRMDSGSPWVLANHPRAKYWDSKDKSFKPNKEYELWMLVRASTAAPLYFKPVEVTITEKGSGYTEQKGLFIDGAVGGFNNPSMQALKLATLPSYGFRWQAGHDRMLLVSVGTGWWRMKRDVADLKRLWNWQKATEALSAMIQDTVLHNITAMQAISEPRKPWYINGEIEWMRGERVVRDPIISYQRFDASLEADNICRVCHLEPNSKKARKTIEALRQIGSSEPHNLEHFYALGYDAGRVTKPGENGIELEDFPAVFDPPFLAPRA